MELGLLETTLYLYIFTSAWIIFDNPTTAAAAAVRVTVRRQECLIGLKELNCMLPTIVTTLLIAEYMMYPHTSSHFYIQLYH